jgi:hypothetical protein
VDGVAVGHKQAIVGNEQQDSGYRHNIARAFGVWRDWLEESAHIEPNGPAMMLFDTDLPMQRNLLSLHVDYLINAKEIKGPTLTRHIGYLKANWALAKQGDSWGKIMTKGEWRICSVAGAHRVRPPSKYSLANMLPWLT